MENPEILFSAKGKQETESELSFNPGAVICWNYYNGELLKHMLFPQVNTFIQEHTDTILRRKLGPQFITTLRANPSQKTPVELIRYVKAVCWRLTGDYQMNKPTVQDPLQRAEQQIPTTVLELVYIEHGGDYANQLETAKEFENTSFNKQRKHLNDFLDVVKNQ